MANNANTTKVFTELSQIDVKDKVKQKDTGKTKLSYLPWSSAVSILAKYCEEKGIEWSSEIVTDDVTGRDFFDCGEAGAYVKVAVTVNGVRRVSELPIMDGANRAMKAVPYEIITKYGKVLVAAYTATEINKAQQRCLVRAIALHGLGIYIYEGEEAPDAVDETPEPAKANATTKAGLPAPEKKAKEPEKIAPPSVDSGAELPGAKPQTQAKAPSADDSEIDGLKAIKVPDDVQDFGGKTLGAIAAENIEDLRKVAALIADKTTRANIVKLYNAIVLAKKSA